MASTIVNAGPIQGLDYVGLRPAKPLKLNSGRIQIKTRPQRLFTVRASEGDGPIGKTRLSDAECEAAVVAGNVPHAPPAPPKPAAPAGTPVVPLLVSSLIKVKTFSLFSCSKFGIWVWVFDGFRFVA